MPPTPSIPALSLAFAPGPNAAQWKRSSDQELFSDIIAKARSGPKAPPEEAARSAAEQLISTALVQPIFKRLRESNRAAPPFGPTPTERSFGPMLDAGFAQRMVHSQHWGLVDSLAQRMLKKMGGDTAPLPAKAIHP